MDEADLENCLKTTMLAHKEATTITPAETRVKQGEALLFMDLPPEVRNAIYALALVEQNDIRASFNGHSSTRNDLQQPPLTRTSRAIRKEALPVYYGANRFKVFVDPKWLSRLMRLLSNLGTSNRKMLHELQIWCCTNECSHHFWMPHNAHIPDLERALVTQSLQARVEKRMNSFGDQYAVGFVKVIFEDDANEVE